jgi:hypothetical protein
MSRYVIPALSIAFFISPTGSAQAQNYRFRWQTGQVLEYRVEQTTAASELVDGKKSESSTKLQNVKRWQVLNVDQTGNATLQLTLTSLKLETTTPSGEVLKFDSAVPQVGDPQMREQLSKYVGAPLMVVRVDPLGKVIEVKDCKFGSPNRLECEPPFGITFPANGGMGNEWERSYQVTLEPPHGTGEKFEAMQKYAVKSTAIKPVGNVPIATITFTTNLKTQPDAVADRAPLLQVQPEGEVVFNTQAGIVESIRLRVEKELQGHQGEGSVYRFQSTSTEQYIGNGSR